MAAMTTTASLGLILLYAIDYAISGQQSGILSSLYKKAAQENRPMILVIDDTMNTNAGKNRDLVNSEKFLPVYVPKKTQDFTAAKKQSSLDSYTDRDEAQKAWPLNLLQHLSHPHNQKKDKSRKPKVYDYGITKSRLRNKDHGWLRQRSQLDKDDRNDLDRRQDRDYWDRREDRDRRDRFRDDRDRRDRDRDDRGRLDRDRDYRDRRDRDRDNRDRRDRPRDFQDRRDRYIDDRDQYDSFRENRDRYDSARDDRDRRDRDWDDRDRRDRYRNDQNRLDRDRDNRDRVEDHTLRALEKELNDRILNKKDRDTQKETKIQKSVMRNLLRITNDLNCEAQDECSDKCETKYNGKKQDECEDKCEAKFECNNEVDKEDDCNGKSCDDDNECADSGGCEEEINPSTKGVLLENGKCRNGC